MLFALSPRRLAAAPLGLSMLVAGVLFWGQLFPATQGLRAPWQKWAGFIMFVSGVPLQIAAAWQHVTARSGPQRQTDRCARQMKCTRNILQ